MKKDSSRDTFDARKHYSRVLMQQGRVQVDADWNEQGEIIAHRAETEAGDVIGRCGAPMHDAGFHIVATFKEMHDAEHDSGGAVARPMREGEGGDADTRRPLVVSDFLITAGRYYVDGILCENERLSSYRTQPDLPAAPPMRDSGFYLIYLDVWQRHLTALDDPSIREVALGGPDTATRAKTVWQVEHLYAGAGVTPNCLTSFDDFDALRRGPSGTLSARTKPQQTDRNPCIVPPGAGYRGLENQLYRVEIHHSGQAVDMTAGGGPIPVTPVSGTSNQVTYTSGTWTVGQAIELLSGKRGTSPMSGSLAVITAVDDTSKTLTLNADPSALAFEQPVARPVSATYKWSRNNGAVVTAIEDIDGQEITVHDVGPDEVLGFKKNQWVEITNDVLELHGESGQLARIIDIDPAINLITLDVTPSAVISSVDALKTSHPKLRAWDGVGAVKFLSGVSLQQFLELEDGVEVRFFPGTYRTGDYWTIPARTATADAQSGNIEWPVDTNKDPLPQSPFGIRHHYCRLAILQWDSDKNAVVQPIEDCRKIFPPITELTTLVYVSGDGQEAMPGHPIPQRLEVGVFNGRWPVPGARVKFETNDDGYLAKTEADLQPSPATKKDAEVTTGADGIAGIHWRLESNVAKHSQQVTARLLDAANDPTPAIVRFNGNLSIANQVFYDPGTCLTLQGQHTVQDALHKLSTLVSLYEVSGNDQELMRPGILPEPLVVLAASPCGPVLKQQVRFEVLSGGGTVNPSEPTPTGLNGLAQVVWTLGSKSVRQEVKATLIDDRPGSMTPPTAVHFTATLRQATDVAYDPGCDFLKAEKVTTVAEAITALCNRAPEDERGMVIDGVATLDGRKLENDTLVTVDRLVRGISISCTEPLEAISVGTAPNDPPTMFTLDHVASKPTCFVTLDVPYEVQSVIDDRIITAIPGFSPIILASDVSVKENAIVWQPTRTCRSWLDGVLFQRLQEFKIADRVLAHLTLKGNYIWAVTDSGELHLDGEVFGAFGEKDRIHLPLPSGNRRKGGDFEMWFWLMPPQEVNPGGNTRFEAGVVANGNVFARVLEASGAGLPGITVTLSSPTTGTRTAVTNESGSVTFPALEPGTYTLSARFGGAPLEKTVTVPNRR